MRTINQIYKELKNFDEESTVTLSGLRRLVKTGQIPSVQIGRVAWISIDEVISFLQNPTKKNATDSQLSKGEVRKIY